MKNLDFALKKYKNPKMQKTGPQKKMLTQSHDNTLQNAGVRGRSPRHAGGSEGAQPPQGKIKNKNNKQIIYNKYLSSKGRGPGRSPRHAGGSEGAQPLPGNKFKKKKSKKQLNTFHLNKKEKNKK